MVEADAVFAEPPAEINLFIVDQCREIEQTNFKIFDEATRLKDAIQRGLQGFGELLVLENVRFEPGETRNDPQLARELAAREGARLAGGALHFAWEGPVRSSARHYYRVQGDDLLIEYDTTSDGNHAHTVLRRPRSDFGDDVLAEHYRQAHS